MASQFLTAVLELQPTRRKAAALERVRATAEAVFWAVIAGQRARADAVAAVTDKTERRSAWRTAQTGIASIVIAASTKAGLAEPVAHGLVRDVQMAIGSYVELRAGAHEAEWPAPAKESAGDHCAALT